VRKAVGNDSITPIQIRQALSRIWSTGASVGTTLAPHQLTRQIAKTPAPKPGRKDYQEAHHTQGKPREVVELYRALDRFCQDLAPGEVTRKYLAQYVSWSVGKPVFCCAHLQQSGLRVWVKIDPGEIPKSATFARDVSSVGHWGVGDVELAINSMQRLRDAEHLIRTSFASRSRR